MLRSIVFIFLAVALATVSFGLTQVSPNPFFGYGVAFIGYSVASLLTLVAVFVRD
jgi:ABC-type transport system involved in cytochrome c biogenesis permease component